MEEEVRNNMAIKTVSEVAISYPFTIDAYGNIAATNSYTKIWNDRVLAALNTANGERVMDWDLGTQIPYMVFDSGSESAVETEIRKAFLDYLPALTVDDVNSTFDINTGTITVNLTYSLPNNDQITTTVGVVTVAGNNPPYEENK
jgi:hypothetical protein